MSYEYDAGSTRLLVEQDKTMDGVTPLALVQAMDLGLGTVAVAVKPEDAPALTLAILEAAGVTERDPAEWNASSAPERLALYWLYQWQGLRKAETAREAEDAMVRAWMRGTGRGLGDEKDWASTPEGVRNMYRNEYQRNAEHFTREVTE